MTESNGTFRVFLRQDAYVLTYDQKWSHHGLDLQKLIEKVPMSNQQEASKFRQRCVGRTSALCTTVNSATGRGQEDEACLPSLFFPTCNWRWLTCSKRTSKNQILLIINCLKIWDQINSVIYLTGKEKNVEMTLCMRTWTIPLRRSSANAFRIQVSIKRMLGKCLVLLLGNIPQ